MNRIIPESVRSVSGEALRGGYQEAAKTLTPSRIDLEDLRQGYLGRYADGGRERFLEMTRSRKLSAEDLAAIEARHARNFLTFLVFSGIFLVGAALFMGFGSGVFKILGAAILVIFALGSMAIALQADLSRYQIRMQRFCGFSEYLGKGFFRS